MFDFLKRKKRIMRSFKLNEISAVDRPAQEPATMAIMKRDDREVRKIVRGDVMDLAEHVAGILADEGADKAEELGKAFEEFDAGLVKTIEKVRRAADAEEVLDPAEQHFQDIKAHRHFRAGGNGEVTRKLATLLDNAVRAAPSILHEPHAWVAAWNQLSDFEKDQVRQEEIAEIQRERKDTNNMNKVNRVAGIETQPTEAITDDSVDAFNVDNPEVSVENMRRLVAEMLRRAPWLDAAALESRVKPASKSFNNEVDMEKADLYFNKFIDGINEGHAGELTEHDVTRVAVEYCQKFRKQGQTREQCLADFLEHNPEVGKAIAATRQFPQMSRPSSREERLEKLSKSNPDALGQLRKLAEQHQKQHGGTRENAFATVYKNYPDLAAAERIQNRP